MEPVEQPALVDRRCFPRALLPLPSLLLTFVSLPKPRGIAHLRVVPLMEQPKSALSAQLLAPDTAPSGVGWGLLPLPCSC